MRPACRWSAWCGKRSEHKAIFRIAARSAARCEGLPVPGNTRALLALPFRYHLVRFVSPDRPLYNRSNPFWTSHGLPAMVAGLDRDSREALTARLVQWLSRL